MKTEARSKSFKSGFNQTRLACYMKDGGKWGKDYRGYNWPTGAVCVYCGVEVTYQGCEIDHVVPVCQNGPDNLGNLVTSCYGCNQNKWGRTPWQAGLIPRYGRFSYVSEWHNKKLKRELQIYLFLEAVVFFTIILLILM
jgi:5-methylcytosine-specific restriction endonuclease McrA